MNPLQVHRPPVSGGLYVGPSVGLDPSDLMTPGQLARALDISVKTLATWRSTGRHALPFIRCGARIRYRRQDVAAWLESRVQACRSEGQGARNE